MANIKPTQNFVLIQFVSTDGLKIILPDGVIDPDRKIIVVEVGPDVPKVPAIVPGSSILLRGDAKLYEGDSKNKMVIVDSRWITGVFEEEALLTDSDIDKIAVGNS